MKQLQTIDYYNQNAARFTAETVQVNFESTQKRFAGKLPAGAAILDFGCGSGRDTKCFLSQGYQVDAVDGSAELCRLAGEYTGVNVKNMFFHELAEVERYDGIWACSSILHLPPKELADVMRKMVIALKYNGIIYTSFKYGTFAGERNGRYFTDMTEDTFADFIKQIKNIKIEEEWITSDVRPERSEEKWLNLILRKE
jgi:2-polyprenyl-3-methyl-5-hydroxy-6-metoxy-1,4-benzoquinol methylase